MKRYIFSGGQVRVDEDANLRPRKRRHPLRSSPIWIKLPDGPPKPLIPADDFRPKYSETTGSRHGK